MPLRSDTAASGGLYGQWLWAFESTLDLDAVSRISHLRARNLRGRSVLLYTKRQLSAALALFELDGVVRRLVICPPDVATGHLAWIAAAASIDVVVCDRASAANDYGHIERIVFDACETAGEQLAAQEPHERTEWVLVTSGTTGPPKLVVHMLSSLTAPMAGRVPLGRGSVWSTFYDIRRYGGLQIFLRAMLGGGSMVLSDPNEGVETFLTRCAAHNVTYISGTPSHWRRALMSPAVTSLAPRYVRLSGEIADQAILDRLSITFPGAQIVHAFASTEAGLAFEVHDGLSGFPANLVGQNSNAVEIEIAGGSMRIKSNRTASQYLGDGAPALKDLAGFVDTGDAVDLRTDRFYFAGRRDGIVNVGGLKVHPEEVEAVINGHPRVRMSRVTGRRSPILGAVIEAEIVADLSVGGGRDADVLKKNIVQLCRSHLAKHKVPVSIRFVPALEITASGKVERRCAM